MSKKINTGLSGLVYSTDPNFKLPSEEEEKIETLAPAAQKLRIKLETKHRAGKAVTLITGFIGTEDDLEVLGKLLRNHCGTGGSSKDGEIIVQGDQRDKVLKYLEAKDYKQSKKI